MESSPAKVSQGHVLFPHGSIFWRSDNPKVSPTSTHRPTLLFIHAGVTDHTLWDDQVEYFTSEGWACLRFDMFGYGKSLPSPEYLASDPRQPIDHTEIVHLVKEHVLPMESDKVVVVGLSIGGGLAVSYTLAHPDVVAGLVVVAGGLSDFQGPQNTPEEEALFDDVDRLQKTGDIPAAAALQVRIWADGPFQPSGRFLAVAGPGQSQRMTQWNLDICQRDHDTGPIPVKRNSQPALQRMHEIKAPCAIAYGELDETYTTETMKHLGSKLEAASLTSGAKAFPTAHMVNLEVPGLFNAWLREFLDSLRL